MNIGPPNYRSSGAPGAQLYHMRSENTLRYFKSTCTCSSLIKLFTVYTSNSTRQENLSRKISRWYTGVYFFYQPGAGSVSRSVSYSLSLSSVASIGG